MNQTLAETLEKGLNNPDCAFFVGGLFGELLIVEIIFTMIIALIVYRFVERLAITPFTTWLKEKLTLLIERWKR